MFPLEQHIPKYVEPEAERLCTTLAMQFHFGLGVAKDYAEAERLYRLAATQGCADAQYHLGGMFEYGDGVAQDYAEAMRFYRLAAAQGHAKAQYHLGRIFDEGKGVPQDMAEAVRLHRLAAAQGHVEAMVMIVSTDDEFSSNSSFDSSSDD